MRGTRRAASTAVAVCAFIGAIAPVASAHQTPPVPKLNWQPCGDAPNVTCTTAGVPLDYDAPNGQSIKLFLAKSPATVDQQLRAAMRKLKVTSRTALAVKAVEAGVFAEEEMLGDAS